MARERLILVCASLILTQLVIVNAGDDIDWTTIQDELRKLAGGLRKKCTGENPSVTNEMLEAAELGDFSNSDKGLACYFKCVLEKAGIMKKDGKINYKLLGKMMPQAFKHIGMQMLDQCKTIEGNDKCTKAMNFNQCMFEANPVAYFVI